MMNTQNRMPKIRIKIPRTGMAGAEGGAAGKPVCMCEGETGGIRMSYSHTASTSYKEKMGVTAAVAASVPLDEPCYPIVASMALD